MKKIRKKQKTNKKKQEQTSTKRKRKHFVHCGNPTLFSTIEFLSLALFKVVLYVTLFVFSFYRAEGLSFLRTSLTSFFFSVEECP